MKALEQQVRDALYYLKKPGQNPADEAKAIEILSHVAFGKKEAKAKMKAISKAGASTLPKRSGLKGKQIGIVVGHEPGGGASGERTYQKIVGKHMVEILEAEGAKVFYYEHKLKSYGARQRAMKVAVKNALPDCWSVIELHYDGYKPSPSASGHHFQYRGAKVLASAIRDEFQKRYPQSKAREDNGIKHNPKGNGAGFLRESPGWACLVEPYFITNPGEKVFFKDKHRDLAEVYCIGLSKFARA